MNEKFDNRTLSLNQRIFNNDWFLETKFGLHAEKRNDQLRLNKVRVMVFNATYGLYAKKVLCSIETFQLPNLFSLFFFFSLFTNNLCFL